MENIEVLSLDEERTIITENNKRGKGIPKMKRTTSKSLVRNIKKPQTRLSKK